MASLSVSGLVPMSPAMAGSDVAMTVESMFSMNRAVATISGIIRCLFIEIICDDGTSRKAFRIMAWWIRAGLRIRGAQLIFSFSSFAGEVERRLRVSFVAIL